MCEDSDYYFNNTAGTMLTQKGLDIIKSKIDKIKCPVCGGNLVLIQMMEGAFIDCQCHPYWDDPEYIKTNKGKACKPWLAITIRRDKTGPVVLQGEKELQ